MVVIEGPRFSTRAESQSYAAPGWTVVNMTGHPEAVLARELGLCYATIALVTDLDAGVSKEESVDQAQVFALFEKHIGRLKELLGRCGRAPLPRWRRPDELRLRRLARRRHPAVRAPGPHLVRVLLTGSAGLHRLRDRRAADRPGRRGRAGRRADPAGARRPTCPSPRACTGSTYGMRGSGRTCSTASTWSATRPRWSAPVSRSPTCRSYAAHNDLGTAALLAAMHDAGVDALVLARSMVVYGEGRYACEEHGEQPPPAREPRRRSTPATSRTTARCATGRWPGQLVAGGRPARPAQQLRREQGGPGALHLAWVRQAGARAIGLRYHNVYGPGMPRDTPYSGVAAIFRSSLEHGRPPRVFEDGGQMRDFVHVHDVARANLLSLDAVLDRPAESWAAYNVCSGTPVPIRRVAEILAEASGGPEPEVTGDYRPGDVRHVVASPELATTELGFTAAITPDQGITEFATAPLRSCLDAETSRVMKTPTPPKTSYDERPERAEASQMQYGDSQVSVFICDGSAADRLSSVTSRRGFSPAGEEQVLHHQGEGDLDHHAHPSPAVGEQGAGDQQPGHERQPDALDLGATHLGQVGREHHQHGRSGEPPDHAHLVGRRGLRAYAGSADRPPRRRRADRR